MGDGKIQFGAFALAGFALALAVGGFAQNGRAEVIVTVTDDTGPLPQQMQTSPAGPGIDIFSFSSADSVVALTATDASPTSPGYITVGPTVVNLLSTAQTIKIKIEDTWTGNAGFTNPTGSSLPLEAQLSDTGVPGSGSIAMQGGFSSPVSGTPMDLTGILNVSSGGYAQTATEVVRSSAGYELFTLLTFNVAPHATITASATTSITTIPEPATSTSLIGLACGLGLCSLWHCRRRTSRLSPDGGAA